MSVVAGKRNVAPTPANKMFYAVDEAKGLAVHTIEVTANTKIFDLRYNRVTQTIVNTAIEIYSCAWEANNVLVKTSEDWQERRRLQLMAARKCNTLLCQIELAKPLYHLRAKKARYWTEKTMTVRKLLRAWHDADQERYGKIK